MCFMAVHRKLLTEVEAVILVDPIVTIDENSEMSIEVVVAHLLDINQRLQNLLAAEEEYRRQEADGQGSSVEEEDFTESIPAGNERMEVQQQEELNDPPQPGPGP